MAVLSWALFFYYRKVLIEELPFEVDVQFFYGILIVPIFWLGIHFFLGTYRNIKRLYFIRIISLTFKSLLLGTLILFFSLVIDDEIETYSLYYNLLTALFTIHLILFFIPRLIITKIIVGNIHHKKWSINTILIGGNQSALDIYKEIESLPKSSGEKFIGFISLNGIDKKLKSELEHLGTIEQLEEIINKFDVEEVIIALESSEHERLKQLISRIQGRDIQIKMIPDMFDLVSGSVKTTNIFGAILIDVNQEIMPFWQFVIKRCIDILASLIAMIILIPVYIILAIAVRSSSKGPIFFKQERIGKNGVPFNIIKFRTMYINAEEKGPQLSSENDPRITKYGRIMRKMRLDELPQFWNVFVGEMSLVGPRPERQFYIDKISAIEPQYLQLTKVKPGITSWGQVKFGYAETVEEMLQRMKFDLLYLKNMSIALDIKIMLHTIIIVFKGTGK